MRIGLENLHNSIGENAADPAEGSDSLVLNIKKTRADVTLAPFFFFWRYLFAFASVSVVILERIGRKMS